jgi:hypothetical protein
MRAEARQVLSGEVLALELAAPSSKSGLDGALLAQKAPLSYSRAWRDRAPS